MWDVEISQAWHKFWWVFFSFLFFSLFKCDKMQAFICWCWWTCCALWIFLTALEIFGYSALFCIPVLIPIAVTSHQNEQELQINPNNTYEPIDNLAIGNVEVSGHHLQNPIPLIFQLCFQKCLSDLEILELPIGLILELAIHWFILSPRHVTAG